MAHWNAARRAEIQAQIDTKTAQLTAANTTLESLLSESVESYKFDSGEGSQQAKRRKIDDLMALIQSLEAQIDWLRRKLQSGGGPRAINVRRV
jgi:chromosome segregation ATPase